MMFQKEQYWFLNDKASMTYSQGAYLRLKQQQDHSMFDSYRSYFHPKVHQFIPLGYALDMFDIWQKSDPLHQSDALMHSIQPPVRLQIV